MMDAVNHLLRRSRARSFHSPVKRLTPEEVEAIQSSLRASALSASAASATRAAAAINPAQPDAISASSYSFYDKFGHATSAQSSAVTTKAAATSTPSTTSITPATTSKTTANPSPSPTSQTTSNAGVETITQGGVGSSSSSAVPTASAAAASQRAATQGLSTGAIAGIVVAALVGFVVLGSTVGWLYRKWATRSYSSKSPWSKMDDDDITPYPPNEKLVDDDVYGASAAPVIGSRRALALARQNNFNNNGDMRPRTEYMIAQDGNRAGVGSGYPSDMYGAYPQFSPPQVPNSRQLLGPVPLGRPSPPTNHMSIEQHEDFEHQPWTPRTATTTEWPGDARAPQSRSRVSMITPRGEPAPETLAVARMSPTEMIRPPERVVHMPAPLPLPAFDPVSPFMSTFDLSRNSTQPMYEDEETHQRRMYTEVANAAGVVEPPTPGAATPGAIHQPAERLPTLKAPYIHGQPLFPLTEVPTPSTLPKEPNPFERTLIAAGQPIPSPAYPPPSPGDMSVPGSVTNSPRRWSGGGPKGRAVSMFDGDDAYGGI